MAASAEVIISPEVDKKALNKMNKQYQASFKKVAKDAEKQIEKGVAKGVSGGAKKGGKALSRMGRFGRGAKKAGRAGFDRIGGARGIATGMGGIVLAGFINAIDRAAGTRDQIGGILGGSTASGQLAGAKAAGFSSDQFGQFSSQLQSIGGLQDPQAIADLLQDINVKVQENIVDGGVLSNFGKYTGQERINRVLAGISQESEGQQQETLNQIGITGEDGRAMLALVQKAGESGNFEAALEFLNEAQKTEGQIIGDNLKKEAALAKLYREKQLEFNNEQRKQFLNTIKKEDIETLITAQQGAADKELKDLKNFSGKEGNQNAATKSAMLLETTMAGMSETSTKILGAIEDMAQSIDELINQSWFDGVLGSNGNKSAATTRKRNLGRG